MRAHEATGTSDPDRVRPDAVVLASGGLDSTTLLAIAQAEGFEPLPLTFRYGQRHEAEIDFARRLVAKLGLREHLILPVPFAEIGGSSLLCSSSLCSSSLGSSSLGSSSLGSSTLGSSTLGDGEIPDESPAGAGSGGIPSTYVPARNLVFLSLAVAVAESRGIGDIFIGVNALDYSGYPDCRPAFIDAFETTACLGTRDGVLAAAAPGAPAFRIHRPLIDLSKAEIIARGTALGVDYSQTISCYRADANGRACGRCDACGLRRRGFEQAGIPDPTSYR